MTKRHEVKGDETMAFRVPSKIAAALEADALIHETTRSEIMRQILEQKYCTKEGCKPLPSFANNTAELETVLEKAEQSLQLLIALGGKVSEKKARLA
jgi:hypothetical protein